MNAIKLKMCGSLVIFTALMSACTPEMSARNKAITTTTAALPITQTAPPTSPPLTQTAIRTPTGTRTPTVTATIDPAQTAICIENVFVPQSFVPDSLLLLVRKDSPEEGFGVQAIDLVSGEVESSLESPEMVYTTALSPDGKMLAWALEDNSIQLLTYPHGELLHSWEAHTQRIDDLSFSPDGQRLYSASYDNWVRVWDMQGELVDEYAPGGGEAHAIGISPDGRLAAVVTFEGPQKLWDLESKQVVAELSPNGAFSPSGVTFTADGSMVGLSLGGFPVSLWTVPEGEQVWSGGNFSLALSQEGRYMAYSDVDQDGHNQVVIAKQDGSEIIHTLKNLPSFAWNLLFSPDGSLLVESSDAVRVWEVETAALLIEYRAECP